MAEPSLSICTCLDSIDTQRQQGNLLPLFIFSNCVLIKKSFPKCPLIHNRLFNTLLQIKPQIITPAYSRKDNIPQLLLKLLIDMDSFTLDRIPFPTAKIPKHLAQAYYNLAEVQFLVAPDFTALL